MSLESSSIALEAPKVRFLIGASICCLPVLCSTLREFQVQYARNETVQDIQLCDMWHQYYHRNWGRRMVSLIEMPGVGSVKPKWIRYAIGTHCRGRILQVGYHSLG